MNENNINNEQEVIKDEFMDFVERTWIREGNFDTKSLNYLPGLDIEDKNKIAKFGSLYDRIDDYARSQGFGPFESNGYCSYNVKYNNAGYSIVRSYSENVHFCFKNRTGENLDNYIDFNLIKEREQRIQENNQKRYTRTLY